MTIIAAVTAGNYTHYLDVTLLSQDRASNTSTLSYNYYIHRNTSAGNGAWTGTANHTFTTNVDGQGGGGARTFDFRVAADISMASGTIVVAHNSDGTKSISGSFSGPNPTFTSGFPQAAGSGSMALPTIIRNRAKVGVAGVWKDAEVYVGINGAWVPARPYVGVAGVWREVSPT